MAFPLTDADLAAHDFALRRAPYWLMGELRRSGYVWNQRLDPLNTIMADAVRAREPARDVARRLAKALRSEGIFLDAQALAQTEMALLRTVGSWAIAAANWKPDTLIFRQTSTHACRACLRLHKAPDGTPRLWRVGEVDVPGARRPNRGPRAKWLPKIAPLHRRCSCTPWAAYHPAMRLLFEQHAERYRTLMRVVGLS